MAATEKILYQGQPGIADTSLYPVPTLKKTTVTSIILGNTDTAAHWITLNIVPSGSAATNSNIFGGRQKKISGTSDTLGGGEIFYDTPIPLKAGDSLHGIQELATAISVTIIGIEEDV